MSLSGRMAMKVTLRSIRPDDTAARQASNLAEVDLLLHLRSGEELEDVAGEGELSARGDRRPENDQRHDCEDDSAHDGRECSALLQDKQEGAPAENHQDDRRYLIASAKDDFVHC